MKKCCPICQSICPDPGARLGAGADPDCGLLSPTAVFWCLSSFADDGAGFAPPRYAGGNCKFAEQGVVLLQKHCL